MLTPEEKATWQARWSSQNDYLTALATSYSNNLAPRMKTLYALVECLRVFGTEQFQFFANGFSGLTPNLEKSDKFPAQFALAATLEQIAYDTAVIEQAANQRFLADNLEKQGKPEMFKTLSTADYLAEKSLEALKSQNILREPTTVLTYFQKAASVRVIPYAPVVLVAIPYSCLGNPRDFLAIPHEVGHYVYRHGRFLQNTQPISPASVLPNGINGWCKSWFEEIFADVFGALVAGPIIALDFQDLQLTFNSEDFISNDGDHPTPNLRPYIYIKVLEEAKSHPTWVSKLRENWEKHLEERSRPETLGKFKMQNGQFSDIEAAITTNNDGLHNKPVDIAIEKALSLLHGIEATFWTSKLTEPTTTDKVEDLYDKFEEFLSVKPLNGSEVPDLSIETNSKILYVGNKATTRQLGQSLFNEKTDDARVSSSLISKEVWLTVLDAAGWTTQGPQCEKSGGICG